MALKIEEGAQSDFIYSIRNKSRLGISTPPINTNRSISNLGSAIRPVPLVPHGMEKEPVPYPDEDCCGPDVSPTAFVYVEFIDSPYSLSISDEIISADATGGDVYIDLPPASSTPAGQAFHIKKVDASLNIVYIRPDGTDELDQYTNGAPFPITAQWTSIMVLRTNDDNVTEWEVH